MEIIPSLLTKKGEIIVKNKTSLLAIAILFIVMRLNAQDTGTFTDTRDNKTYKTIKIGNQIWMAENIAYKSIAGCWAYDNDKENVPIYGYLYNWESVNQVCPNGWHLPSDDEWNQLTSYLGGEDVAKGKLKETGTVHWSNTNNGNRDANNESGFNALPGGSRTTLGAFIGAGGNGYWWSSTKVNSSYIWCRYLTYGHSDIFRYWGDVQEANSARCIRDY